MFFGEYLVEKELISDEQLLSALVTQLRSEPSLPEMVFEHSLLSTDVQLAAFKLQYNEGLGYIEALRALKIDVKKLMSDIEHHSSIRKLLGQVLVESGFLSLAQLEEALKGFQESLKLPVLDKKTVEKPVAVQPTTSLRPRVEDIEMPDILHRPTVDELVAVFPKKLCEQALQSYQGDSVPLSFHSHFGQQMRHFYQSADFIGASQVSLLSRSISEVLEKISGRNIQLGESELQLIYFAVEVLVEMVETLRSTSSEFGGSAELRARHENLNIKLSEYLLKIEEKTLNSGAAS